MKNFQLDLDKVNEKWINIQKLLDASRQTLDSRKQMHQAYVELRDELQNSLIFMESRLGHQSVSLKTLNSDVLTNQFEQLNEIERDWNSLKPKLDNFKLLGLNYNAYLHSDKIVQSGQTGKLFIESHFLFICLITNCVCLFFCIYSIV